MISVLTITYKRHHLLEEAIQSFLEQDFTGDCELVVINDNADVNYIYNHPKVRIINHKERFPSISAKLEWGYKQCNYSYIYRLDDDDLLTPWGLSNVAKDIENNSGFEIYRSRGMYFFVDNRFEKESDNINNVNVYTKAYLDRIKFPNRSGDEDNFITYGHNASIYQSKLKHTMIYRWGMNTFHISGLGQVDNSVILGHADKVLDNITGDVKLNPHFNHNYYDQLK